jgi:uncharacterized protein YaaW (UPF0174 family)
MIFLTDYDYEEISKNVLKQIERNILVNKPYLIHIIQYSRGRVTNENANEIIRKMMEEKKIEEHLALSKKQKPYSFYTLAMESKNISKILAPLLAALTERKELSILEASRLTGYSDIVVRTLFTHLLLEGKIDFHCDLDSPVFFVPWDEK